MPRPTPSVNFAPSQKTWGRRMIEPHLEKDIVFVADLDDIGMSHEWVEVDLVDHW